MGRRLRKIQQNNQIKFDNLTGTSPQMQLVYQRINEAASSDVPVLILGESGTGKELVAESIHQRSKRGKEPFVPVNTGAISKELVASELFGHQKGAFTGATETKAGKFEQAYGGTLFLDEVSTMDEITQVSLLRVLENNKVQRVGGKKFITIDVRIITASNEDLQGAAACSNHIIREDLFYRINVFTISLPPLRDRLEDIAILAREFVKDACTDFKKNKIKISKNALQILNNYSWPGNVRELKNIMQRAVLICKGKTIYPEHIPERISTEKTNDKHLSIPIGTSLKEVERITISKTLVYTKGNKKEAAKLLGISRRSLYDKLRLYGLL